jgi:hypothetical protein
VMVGLEQVLVSPASIDYERASCGPNTRQVDLPTQSPLNLHCKMRRVDFRLLSIALYFEIFLFCAAFPRLTSRVVLY